MPSHPPWSYTLATCGCLAGGPAPIISPYLNEGKFSAPSFPDSRPFHVPLSSEASDLPTCASSHCPTCPVGIDRGQPWICPSRVMWPTGHGAVPEGVKAAESSRSKIPVLGRPRLEDYLETWATQWAPRPEILFQKQRKKNLDKDEVCGWWVLFQLL